MSAQSGTVHTHPVVDTIARMRFPPGFEVLAVDHHRVHITMRVERLVNRLKLPGDVTHLTNTLRLNGDEDTETIAIKIRERMQWLTLHEIDEWTLLDGVHLNEPHDVYGNGEVKFTADTIRAWNAVKAVVGVFNYGRDR